MVIALTVIALLIQFAGVYALVIQTQRTQDEEGEAADPVCRRGGQAYYNAFAKPPAERVRERHLGA